MNTVLRGRDGLEVVIGRDGPFTPIGERLNPTNKPMIIGVNILSYSLDFLNLILNGNP